MKKINLRDVFGKSMTLSFNSDNYTTEIKDDVVNLSSILNGKYTHLIFNTRNYLLYVEEESK